MANNFLADSVFVEAGQSGNEYEDPSEKIDGMPPNLGAYPIGHAATFQSINTSGAKVYREYDEAIKHSLDNARYMRNDCGIMECLESRQRCVALLDWEIEPEDPESQDQQALADEMTKIVKRIRRFTEYRRVLLEAIWYGKYAIQHQYGYEMVGSKMRLLPKPRHQDDAGWKPINGDKIVFRQDLPDLPPNAYPGQLGIRVGPGFKSDSKIQGRWLPEPTERGMAYFLAPWERTLLAVHKHMIEDAAYEDGLDSGTINGVGIRSRIYWEWMQKQETLAFLMEYLERSAGGIELWHYPQGNAQAKAETETAARERMGGRRNMLLVPIPAGEEGHQYGVQVIEPGMGGIDTLHDILKNYYGHRIKRYILGQTLTSEADATGMNGGVADLHMDTLNQILTYDARNLEETLTHELVREIQLRNFPQSAGIQLKLKLILDSPDIDKKLESWARAYEMGAGLKESQIMDLIGAATPGPDDKVLRKPEQQQMPNMDMGGPPGQPGDGNPATGEPMAGAVDGMESELRQQLMGV
jgi:phage gp29-like protein